MNFTTLTGSKSTEGSIANWLNRSDLPVETILTEAEAFIYQHLRVREMRTGEALTFAAGASTAALPSGFLDPISFTPYTWGRPLAYRHEQLLQAVRDSDGNLFESTPSRWTVLGVTAHVDVKCAEAFSGWLLYYKQPDALSGSNETNFLTTRYPKALRLACMAQGYEHAKKTADAAGYAQAALVEIERVKMTDDLARRGQQ